MPITFIHTHHHAGDSFFLVDGDDGETSSSQLYTPFGYAEAIYRKLGIGGAQRLEQSVGGIAVSLSVGGKPISELF